MKVAMVNNAWRQNSKIVIKAHEATEEAGSSRKAFCETKRKQNQQCDEGANVQYDEEQRSENEEAGMIKSTTTMT